MDHLTLIFTYIIPITNLLHFRRLAQFSRRVLRVSTIQPQRNRNRCRNRIRPLHVAALHDRILILVTTILLTHGLAKMATNTKIYGACYSNVPVYEYNVGPGSHIMRRRAGKSCYAVATAIYLLFEASADNVVVC